MPRLRLDRLCFLIVLVWGSMIGLCQSQSLSILGQKTIRPFAPYAVSITNTLSKDVRLEILLNGPDLDDKKTIKAKRESEQRITFETKNVTDGDYHLSIRSLDHSVTFVENVELISDPRVFSIFIQIDKPVYKPGDTMHFRVIVIDSDTRPVTNLSYVAVGLKDSTNTSIREWQYAKLHNGVFESSVLMPSSPNLGRWMLTVESEQFQVQKFKEFEVQQYVLPKFWIKVYPTEVPLAGKNTIKLTVESEFTFGRPVAGVVNVDLYLSKIRRNSDHSVSKYFERMTFFEFFLNEEVDVDDDKEFADVFVNVTVTEKHTNTTRFIFEPIHVYRNEFDIVLIKPWPMFRPGMPFPLQVSFKDRMGRAAGSGQTVKTQVTYRLNNNQDNETEIVGTISSRGLLSLPNIMPPVTATEMNVQITYESVDFEETIDGAISKSNQYLRIILPDKYNKLRPNREVQFDIVCSEPMSYITYVLVARGVVVDSKLVKTFRRKKYSLKYKMKPSLAPRARIIVFYTNKEYMIWDSMVLDFDVFHNEFKFFLDEKKYNPGQEAYIDVEATSDSYVAFHAIDQSVLLLNDSWNDLTKANIVKEFDSFGDNEFDLFHSLGLFMQTTSKQDSGTGKLTRYGLGFHNAREILHIRTVFPETWLWRNVSMAGKTEVSFSAQVPDTMTSWLVTGFALSPTTGLGLIHEPITFKVEKSFYIVAHLPYSIKRGEVTVIQVMIYNFIGNTLITDVHLYNKNDEIEFVDQSSRDTMRRTKAVIMPGNAGRQVSFLVKAKKIGEIAVKIEAVNNLKQDSVEHILRVEPESYLFRKNEARNIEHNGYNSTNISISIDIPRYIIPGTVEIAFNLDPSFLRIPIENINHLMQIPKEYGEANMLDFVPQVVALDYLTESKMDNENLKNKMINYIRVGYHNQLKYKINDGSFSNWESEQHKKGSIFITSLVAKSFKIAAKHVDGLISNEIVEAALGWLASNQQSDGSFVEVGDKIHNGLQSKYALTAYTLAAFLEVGELASKYSANITSAIDYLVKIHTKLDDPYDLALTAYALSLKQHDAGKKCLDKVIERSSETGAVRTWNEGPFSTEIGSYVVLTYLQYHPVIAVTPIVNWLTKKRSDTGGFSSIQNTFIGLRALAQYALKASVDAYDYTVTLRWKNMLAKKFNVDRYNARDNQTTVVPSDVRQISVEIDGTGLGYYQVAYQYRKELEDAKRGFDLRLELMKDSNYHVQKLKVCTKFRKPEAYTQSNLAYVEVFFPSGLHVNNENAITDLASSNKIMNIKLLNQGTNVRVYYNSLGDFYSCFIVKAERRYDVALHRPAHVVVYDAVDNSVFAIKKYDGIVNQPCDICQDEDCETMACNVTE